jgi:hypothetical protein
MSFFVGNWVTRIYLGAVLASAAFMVAANPALGLSLAGIFLIALTAPVSIIFAPIYLLGEGWLTGPMMIGSILAGYLLNTVLINMITGEIGRVHSRRA